jgi:ribosomal-protein-alanine N-acetyltransferase
LPALAEIHEAGFPHAWDADAIGGLADAPGARCLVAREEGRPGSVTGFVLLRMAADEAEIITIAVAPRHRGGGIGRALMAQAIRELQAERIARLFLEVAEGNAPALALYRSLGFRQVGVRKAYYTSGRPGAAPASALVMERHLR